MSHTPGPWSVTHDSDDILRVVPTNDAQYPICDLGSVDADDWDEDVVNVLKSDARLIAAAPDMLAALQAILAMGGLFDLIDAHDIAAPAVKKALGEALSTSEGEK